jgi:beta-propeller repeat-containing protein/centrosomal CEP192-like protein
MAAYGKLPLGFEQNQGQTDARVKFLAHGSAYTVFLTDGEATLRLNSPSKPQTSLPARGVPSAAHARPEKKPDAVVRLALARSNPRAEVEGMEIQPGRSNYLIGNDPAQWHRNVPHFARVKYRGVYPGVDLVYYGNQRQLESDYVLAPGANPGQIGLRIEGADNLKLDSQGDLVISTAVGEVLLRRPRAYQDHGGNRQEIAANYVQRDARLVGIEVASYDSRQPLIIDPVLAYSTYLGGTGDEFGHGIAVDSLGNAYVTGSTTSTDFPTTTSPFQSKSKCGSRSTAFVTKVNPTGTALVYSTYLGGSCGNVVPTLGGGEISFGIAIDGSGDAYVTGQTSSSDFPITATAYQSTNGGGAIFFTELNPAGSALLYSTYLHGNGGEYTRAIAVDSNGIAYITGVTSSTTFPVILATAFQTTAKATDTAFLSKIDPTKVGTGSLLYSTYLGGSGGEFGQGIAVDSSGNAYITGITTSKDFPIMNAFQTTLKNTNGTAFVTRIDTTKTGSAGLVYSTYLGGSGSTNQADNGNGIALDSAFNAYVVGSTASSDFPTTPGVFKTQGPTNGNTTAFVSKLDTTKSGASSLTYSTFFGGSTLETGFGIAVDSLGDAWITGDTFSKDFPLTLGAPQNKLVGAPGFVSGLNPTATSPLLFSTYFGGNIAESEAIAVDSANPPNLYVTGGTSDGLLTTTAAFQTTHKGSATGLDVFVSKLSPAAVSGVFADPGALDFPLTGVGSASAAQSVTLANLTNAQLTAISITFMGSSANQFTETNTCGTTLAAGKTCTINVTFKPTVIAIATATLNVADSDASSPQTVDLTGSSTSAAVSVTPSSLSFGNQAVGTTSTAQTATLTNSGSSALPISSISISGTNAANFSQTNTCGSSLAAGLACTIDVTFKPTATSAESATLKIADTDPSSPQTVTLSGTGTSSTPDFTIAVTPSSLSTAAGTLATFAATVTSVNGFTGSVSLTCTGAPANSTCALSPTGVTLTANGTQPSAGAINTTARTMAPPPITLRLDPRYPVGSWGVVALALALLAAWIAGRQKTRKLAWGLALISLLSLTSCSGFPHKGTPAGTYTLTITATSGGLAHSVTVSLTVS